MRASRFGKCPCRAHPLCVDVSGVLHDIGGVLLPLLPEDEVPGPAQIDPPTA